MTLVKDVSSTYTLCQARLPISYHVNQKNTCTCKEKKKKKKRKNDKNDTFRNKFLSVFSRCIFVARCIFDYPSPPPLSPPPWFHAPVVSRTTEINSAYFCTATQNTTNQPTNVPIRLWVLSSRGTRTVASSIFK